MHLSKQLLFLGLLTFFLCLDAMLLPEASLRSTLWLIYATQYFCIVYFGLKQRDRWLFLLSPAFIAVSYLSINNFVGAYTFYTGIVTFQPDLEAYWHWKYLHWTTCVILLANLAVIGTQFINQHPLQEAEIAPRAVHKNGGIEIFFSFAFCIVTLTIFSFVDLEFDVFGGSGTFSVFPKTLAALAFVISLAKFNIKGRLFYYLFLLIYFASFSSDDKREAVFLLLPIILIECLRQKQLRFTSKFVSVSVIIAITVFVLILMMSIYRGYGAFNPRNFFSSAQYIGTYIQEDMFLGYFLSNIEINYFFFHLHQSIEYVFNDPQLLLYGSTFLKIFFIPIPRYLFPEKPDSLIEIYTSYHSPGYRDLGGSWVSAIYSEFFWNFHVVGILVLALFFWIMTRWYLRLAFNLRRGVDYRYLWHLFAYQQIMELVRGMGVDQYFAYLSVSAILAYTVFLPVLHLIHDYGRPANKTVRNRILNSLSN